MSKKLDTIKKRIALARKEADYTQEEMAKLLDISQPAYSYYESGDKPLPLRKIHKIAQILNLPASFFLEEHHENSDRETVLEKICTQFEIMNEHLAKVVQLLEKKYS